MKNNIILIGFMGAGKSSVGILYAEKEKMKFLDTDAVIEEMSGMSVSEIFVKQGEEKFRELETGVVKKLLEDREAYVISTGGGLPLRQENRKLLKELGTIVFLDASADTVLERLKGDTSRPLLQGHNVREKVESLLENRHSVYKQVCDIVIDVNKKSLEEIISELKDFMNSGNAGEDFAEKHRILKK